MGPRVTQEVSRLERSGGRGFRRVTLLLMAGLVAQFLTGMWINLYVTLPLRRPWAGERGLVAIGAALELAVRRGVLPLLVHMALGIALGLGGLWHLGYVWRDSRVGSGRWSAVGLIGLVGAAVGGAAFLGEGGRSSSMVMAGGFAAALVGYGMSMAPSRHPDVMDGGFSGADQNKVDSSP